MRWLFGVVLSLFIFLSPSLIKSEERQLLIGLIPEQNIFRQMERYMPLSEYLEKRTGIKVRLTILSRFGDIIDRFTQRGMDGAFFGDLTGVLAMEKLSVEPIVRPVTPDGSSTVHGYIIVRKDSNINTVEDMKGKVIAFVDRATVTGYLYPIFYFRSQGIENIDEFFREYYFTGSHDASVYAVLDGRADVGCVKNTIFENLVKKDPSIGEELKILIRSPEMPDSTLCLKTSLSEDTKRLIRETLLSMSDDSEGQKVLEKMKIKRFIRASKKDFSPVYNMLKAMGLSVDTYQYKLQ